jgi:hypothetical protein
LARRRLDAAGQVLAEALRAVLAADPGLSVFYGDHLDGGVYLTVCRAGEERSIGYMGEAKTG